MDRSASPVSTSSHAPVTPVDSITRSLAKSLPRRGVLGLIAAALVTGGAGLAATPVAASRRRKNGKRRSSQHGVPVSERATSFTSASSIPPNCIYVCCDGTCDSWKMCMKCVKWPKPTTTTTTAVLTQG